MRFSIERDPMLRTLQLVQGAVERKEKMAILANVLLRAEGNGLSVTASDLELELSAPVVAEISEEGETTVQARKLLDICRASAPGSKLEFRQEGQKAIVGSGKSRFSLGSLPATEFPATDSLEGRPTVRLGAQKLKRVLELTSFAMATQDVRYYLNGLLLKCRPGSLEAVATDGHRLALAREELEPEGSEQVEFSVIVPRKAVLEMSRLLGGGDEEVTLRVGTGALRMEVPDVVCTTKLVDGRFPDYERVIPRRADCDKHLVMDREELRNGLQRAAILANELFHGVRLSLRAGTLRLAANNAEKEEAEEEFDVVYEGPPVETAFNVMYLLDALAVLPEEEAHVYLRDSESSCLLSTAREGRCEYVVMPVKI